MMMVTDRPSCSSAAFRASDGRHCHLPVTISWRVERFDVVTTRPTSSGFFMPSRLAEASGFVNYAAVRNGDGDMTVTVCDDKAGTDESSRRAAEWVKENVGATATPPVTVEGDTLLQFSA